MIRVMKVSSTDDTCDAGPPGECLFAKYHIEVSGGGDTGYSLWLCEEHFAEFQKKVAKKPSEGKPVWWA